MVIRREKELNCTQPDRMTRLASICLVVCLYSAMYIPFALCAPKPLSKDTEVEGWQFCVFV